jgi:microcompartment protein CcmK/EutM
MATLPKKATERLGAGLKSFQPILSAAKARDVNESDTVVIVTDILAGVFGYDKYSEITSEHAIRGTFCDLAIKLEGVLTFLVEVKAIGLDLKEHFVKQAVDYAANQGVEWVVLTNGTLWRVYHVAFTKPIEAELVVALDLLSMESRNQEDIGLLGLLAKESWQKACLGDYRSQKLALSRFTLGALLLSEPVLDVLRRELRRLSPDIRITREDIRGALETDVVKREVLDGEKAQLARRQINKAPRRALKTTKAPPEEGTVPELQGDARDCSSQTKPTP